MPFVSYLTIRIEFVYSIAQTAPSHIKILITCPFSSISAIFNEVIPISYNYFCFNYIIDKVRSM